MTEEDPKAGNKIRNIWFGENFAKCDGDISGFSCMTKILNSSAERADASASYMDIVSCYFENNVHVDYTF